MTREELPEAYATKYMVDHNDRRNLSDENLRKAFAGCGEQLRCTAQTYLSTESHLSKQRKVTAHIIQRRCQITS